MKWAQSYLYTLKESPTDAEIPSHKLFVRAGMIRKLGQGVYSYGPLLLRAIRKLEKIIRDEHEKANCIELLMPMVHPRELWEETQRWEKMGKGLLKFKNRLDQDWCLGATHEEVITDYVRKDIKSYRDLPKTLYQIQTKYRDEIRPRFGLLRGREFIMKDAYSFDTSSTTAADSYQKMYEVYKKIFSRLGVEFRIVKADSGDMGGDRSQEFHILADSGEDELLVSDGGDFAANVEVCPSSVEPKIATEKLKVNALSIEEFKTPGLKTIEELASALKCKESELVKTMFYSVQFSAKDIQPIAVLLRGSDDVNPIKIKNMLGLIEMPELLSTEDVKKLTGAQPGSCGPVNLDLPIYVDTCVDSMVNYIVGANKDDVHLKNVNHPRDFKVEKTFDLRLAKDGDLAPDGKSLLKSFRGIEVGHIFYLGTTYTKAMGANYLDKNGKSQPIEMGCYGLGVSRTVQAVIEQSHDKDGMIWPIALAPYHLHICLLDPDNEEALKISNELYNKFSEAGIDCLLDNRKERPGVKFKDADLLGMPLRITIGKRSLENGEIEIVERRTKEKKSIALDSIFTEVMDWWKLQVQ